VLAILLAFTVLYLDRLVEDYGEPVVTDLLAIPFPWAVVLVALGYLTVSLLAGVARWLEPADGETTSSDSQNTGE
jgi:uncharacterized PurR-regulated membrane protein YhhQ (DUF165 family)